MRLRSVEKLHHGPTGTLRRDPLPPLCALRPLIVNAGPAADVTAFSFLSSQPPEPHRPSRPGRSSISPARGLDVTVTETVAAVRRTRRLRRLLRRPGPDR